MEQTFRFAVQFKAWSNGQLIVDTVRRKKSRILTAAQVHFWDRAYLRVTYTGGAHNDGYYSDFSELRKVLYAFTETGLVNFLTEV